MNLNDTQTKVTSDTPEAQKHTVDSVFNHVYFYAEVDTQHTLELIKLIREIDDELRVENLTRSLPDGAALTPIWLHIQSGGGSLFASLAAADQLAAIRTPIYSIVEGYCASGATLLSLACTKRYILPNAFMMIHQLSGSMWGKYEEFKDEVNLQDMAMDKIVDFYASKTRMGKKKVKKLLKHDSWFNAEQCIEVGLVDEIKR